MPSVVELLKEGVKIGLMVKLHHFGKEKSSPIKFNVQYIAHCDVHFASDIAPYRVHSDLMNEISYLIGYV